MKQSPGVDASEMIVREDVEHDVFGGYFGLFLSKHPSVGLIDAVTANSEIANRLAKVGGEVLLPGFTVIDLIALRETVSVCVYSAGSIRKV